MSWWLHYYIVDQMIKLFLSFITLTAATMRGSHRSLQMMEKAPARWPQGVVCYHPISKNIFTVHERQNIHRAFAEYRTKTNINFVPMPRCSGNVCGNCQHGLELTKNTGCWSWVGYQMQEKQQVSLDCEFNGVQGPIHELGHALGLQHEHKHPERTFILIPDLLQDGAADKYKKLDPNVYELTEYDPSSIMHFDLSYEHGICVPNGDVSQYCEIGQETNCTIPKAADCDQAETRRRIKNRGRVLSQGDVRTLNQFYPSTTEPEPRVCDQSDSSTWSCCTETKTCGVGEGDCDTDGECLDGLKCGSNNCKTIFKWGSGSTDCCYQP